MTTEYLQLNQSAKYNKAVSAFHKGDYEQAATLIGESLLEEQSSERWNDWAAAKFLSGRAADAEGGFLRALELDPENLQAVANLGALLAGQERYSEAIPLLEFAFSRSTADQKEATAKLLEACRQGAVCKTVDGTRELGKFCESFTKGLSLQTVSLDRLLFRMMTIEADMRAFARQCSAAVEEIRRSVVAPQTSKKLIPTVSLAEICPELPPIELHAPMGVDGNVSLYELVIISLLVKARSPRGVFEIGTFDGRTALNLSANLPDDGRVFTLDLPREEMQKTNLPLGDGDKLYIDKERSGARFAGTLWAQRITQLYGDSATFDFSPYQGKIDFVFIDGSHAYKYVLNDSRKALGLLRDGKGTILWHDYPGWRGVADALHELFLKDSSFRNLRNIEGTAFAFLQIE